MLKEKITQQDLELFELIKNPVLCNEFIYNLDRMSWEEEFEFTEYQKEMLCDFNQFSEFCTARATGKTVSLTSLITWMLVFKVYPKDYIVYTVPNKAHLQPVWQNLNRHFRSNSLLRSLIPSSGGFNSSSFELALLNLSNLICRIAGQTGTGANVIGLHSPCIFLDEGGYYPWGTWTELQPVLNTFTKGYRMVVAGVPTGLRENNVLYTVDQEDSSYTKHRVSAYDNPRFSEKDEVHAIEQYGGKDHDDFIHLVLGEHGSPIFSIFDRNLMHISNYPVYKLVLDGIKLKENFQDYFLHLSTFPVTKSKYILFGIDLGYTEPTAIVILYEDGGVLKFHGRIQLNKVSYPVQEKIIDYLDSKFKPSIIGIDEGSSGKAVIQKLKEGEEYLHKKFDKRIMPINFSSSLSLGTDSEGNEIKSKTKPFSVSVLQEYSNNHKIVYTSTDLELVSELERMTYSKNPNGEIQYKTLTMRGGKRGEDHFTQALLCASLAYYLENETLLPARKVVRLFQAKWAY